MRPVHRLHHQRQRAQRRLLQHCQRQLLEQRIRAVCYVICSIQKKAPDAAGAKAAAVNHLLLCFLSWPLSMVCFVWGAGQHNQLFLLLVAALLLLCCCDCCWCTTAASALPLSCCCGLLLLLTWQWQQAAPPHVLDEVVAEHHHLLAVVLDPAAAAAAANSIP
jgi:hypothetical protein